jgi:hypothetical protein
MTGREWQYRHLPERQGTVGNRNRYPFDREHGTGRYPIVFARRGIQSERERPVDDLMDAQSYNGNETKRNQKKRRNRKKVITKLPKAAPRSAVWTQ